MGKKVAWVTAYNFLTAMFAEAAGLDDPGGRFPGHGGAGLPGHDPRDDFRIFSPGREASRPVIFLVKVSFDLNL